MKTFSTIVAVALLAIPAAAQTQLVRGEIDGIQGTNQWRLDCTNVRVTTTNPAINLQQLHDATRQNDMMLSMQVIDIGTPGSPLLDIQQATVLPALFDMGNLRIGRSQTWEVFGTPGSLAEVYLTPEALTSYVPAGAFGTWVLGGNAVFFAGGRIGATGQFRFNFTMPNLPQLIGVSFTTQAIVLEPTGPLLTNPDCKEVEN